MSGASKSSYDDEASEKVKRTAVMTAALVPAESAFNRDYAEFHISQ